MREMASKSKSESSSYPPQLVGSFPVRAQISKVSPKEVSESNRKLQTTIPESKVSKLSQVFKPSEHTVTIPIEEKKTMTNTASNNDVD